jgi:hypothetical protein
MFDKQINADCDRSKTVSSNASFSNDGFFIALEVDYDVVFVVNFDEGVDAVDDDHFEAKLFGMSDCLVVVCGVRFVGQSVV